MPPTNADAKRQALQHILRETIRFPGRVTLHAAWVGAAVLAAGNIDPATLSPAAAAFFGGVGVNAFTTLMERLAWGENMSSDDILEATRDAISESGIADALSKEELRQELVMLFGGLSHLIDDALEAQNIKVARILIEETERVIAEIRIKDVAMHNRLSSEFDALHRRLDRLDTQLTVKQTIPIPDKPLELKVFISSPDDVPEERQTAANIVRDLNFDAEFDGKVILKPLRWDDPNVVLPMSANAPAQKSVDRYLVKPSACDLVIVIFWSKLGTATNIDGEDYLSGTHYELVEAQRAAKNNDGVPEVFVYKRTAAPSVPFDDPNYVERRSQWEQVQTFFETHFPPKVGRTEYKTPAEFGEKLRGQLRVFLRDILKRPRYSQPGLDDTEIIKKPPLWEGTPFPGLYAFTEKQAPIFFGRERETDELVQHMRDNRFVAVVGASGSGKSSLVGAGLIPRLREDAIANSKQWAIVSFKPGGARLDDVVNPFAAIYDALATVFPSLIPSDPLERRQKRKHYANTLLTDPLALRDICADLSPQADTLLFIDQFEETFTVLTDSHRKAFIKMLVATTQADHMRIVVTMRSDFYDRCIDFPQLAELLRAGSFPLSVPRIGALFDMITRPAERAGLKLEDGLVGQIVDDTGNEPGNLALLAYTLDELYERRDNNNITLDAYKKLGGVQGAIGTRASDTFDMLAGEYAGKKAAMRRVFHELIEPTVRDGEIVATRRRAQYTIFADDADARTFIDAFQEARLLVRHEGMLEVAHEALLREWDELKKWIAEIGDDLRLLRQYERDAKDWENRGSDPDDQPRHEQLRSFYSALERLDRRWEDLDEPLKRYTEPEAARRLRELEGLPAEPEAEGRRRDIGDRLDVIGDPREGVGVKDGVPYMVWLPVEVSPGPVTIKTDGPEIGPLVIQPFFVAKYQVTYGQYQAFVEAEDGFDNLEWWQDFPEEYRPQALSDQRTKNGNNPRDSISWYQSVAFGRWMNHRLRGLQLRHAGGVLRVGDDAEVRLPTEWEWQWAAQGGSEERAYPWGRWQGGMANTNESGLGRAIAVGMYPDGRARSGAMDMAGNLREWCQNDYRDPTIVSGYRNGENKVLRGGSFPYPQSRAAASYRSSYYNPNFVSHVYGLRLVVAAPIASLASESER